MFNPVRTIESLHNSHFGFLEKNWMWAYLHLGLITQQGGWQKAFIASKYLHSAISLYSADTS